MNELRYLTVAFLLLCGTVADAQKLTGKWEGRMSDEILQLNFLEKNGLACGFSYDYMIANKTSSFCKAHFTVKYDSSSDAYYLNGTHFLVNRGGHVLMRMKIWFEKKEGQTYMMALVGIKSGLMGMFSSPDLVELTKVASKPDNQQAIEDECWPKEQQKPAPVKPRTPQTQKPVPVVPKSDTTIVFQSPPPVKPKVIENTAKIPEPPKLAERKNKEFAHVEVHDKKFIIKVYDNGVIDDDTVSIYYNGKLLADKKRISAEPLVLEVTLDDNAKEHKITMFAENLGSIPPNTALIVVTTSDKRFELHSSASLTENAVMLVEYKPKE